MFPLSKASSRVRISARLSFNACLVSLAWYMVLSLDASMRLQNRAEKVTVFGYFLHRLIIQGQNLCARVMQKLIRYPRLTGTWSAKSDTRSPWEKCCWI